MNVKITVLPTTTKHMIVLCGTGEPNHCDWSKLSHTAERVGPSEGTSGKLYTNDYGLRITLHGTTSSSARKAQRRVLLVQIHAY